MTKLDHVTIAVHSDQASRNWDVETLGLTVEFEVADRRVAALQDDAGLTLFVGEAPGGTVVSSCILCFQVDDVEAKHRELASAEIPLFTTERRYWGYGVELTDPDGYQPRLWDEKSMREKGNG